MTRPATWPLVRALTSLLLALFEATAPYLDGAHVARLGDAASRISDVYPWIAERVLGRHPDTLTTRRELVRAMAGLPAAGRLQLRPHK